MRVRDILVEHKQGYYKPGKFENGNVHFIRISDLTDNAFLDETTTPMIDIEPEVISAFSIKKNDFLFARTGGAGRFCLIKENLNGIFASYLIRFRFNNNYNSHFLRYFFLSDSFQFELKSKIHGGVNQNVHAENLKDCSVPNIPLLEQQRIVAILDKAFEAIDKAKANAEQNLKNAKELFESYLQSAFNPSTRSGQEGEIWEEKTLPDISVNLDSKRIPITKNVRSKGMIPYYGASGIVDYVAEYIFDEDLLCVSEDGANLLARTYPIAFSISGKTWVNNHAHILRFNNMVTQKFVELFLNSIKLDDFVSGMAQPKLNQAMLNSIPIPYPPLPEQKAIVQKLDALSKETKRLEEIYQKKIDDLDELKKSILNKAFEGQL
ncbi:MAG: restriction endonuclease subunit S [Ignavibacteria bacterium]